jgi:hypothetical protein
MGQKVALRAGAGLKSVGSGRAWALHCYTAGFCGLGVWPAGLAQKPGPRMLGLLGYVVKARARTAGLGLRPLRH